MGKTGTVDRYHSSLLVVLPRTVTLGSMLALIHGGAIVAVFGPSSRPILLGGVAFITVLSLTLAVALYGYSRRYYEFDADGITEYRWAYRPLENHLSYEDIHDVTISQSPVQSLLDAGTLRLNEIEGQEFEIDEEMRIRFVDEPWAIYSNIISRTAELHDAVPRREVAGMFDSHGITPASTFDEGRATTTGSTYLMPYAVAKTRREPIIRRAGIGALILSLLIAVPFAVLPFIPLVYAMPIWAVVFVSYFAYLGWYREPEQCELHSEYAKIISAGDVETVPYSDIETISVDTDASSRPTTGSVSGYSADGDTIIEIKYITDPEEFARGFAAIADATVTDD